MTDSRHIHALKIADSSAKLLSNLKVSAQPSPTTVYSFFFSLLESKLGKLLESFRISFRS